MALPQPFGSCVCENVKAQVGSSVLGGVSILGRIDGGRGGLSEPAARIGNSLLCSHAGFAEVSGCGKRLPNMPWHGVGCQLSRHRFGVSPVHSYRLRSRLFLGNLSSYQRVKGIVAGAYFRVGYKAAGDPSDLVQLCSELDLQTFIVNSLRDKSEESTCDISNQSSDKGEVASVTSNLAGGIVALGKFDALHIGHRALAEQAAQMGTPYLLSFSGMAEVLGWQKRLPLVASSDRERVISLWSKYCGGASVREFSLQFGRVRSLRPREFLEKLAYELQVKGVVAGANYRFGYKAAGDASDLVQISSELGLQSFIVDPVMDKSEGSACDLSDKSREKGQVSSTRVRNALSAGKIRTVTELLGRMHRLVIKTENSIIDHHQLQIPLAGAQNQYPEAGSYACNVILDNNVAVNGSSTNTECRILGQVKIEDHHFVVSLAEGHFEDSGLLQNDAISLDFVP